MKEISSPIKLTFLLFLLCLVSHSQDILFMAQNLPYYFPYSEANVNKNDAVKMTISLTGQNQHRHIVLENQGLNPGIQDTSYDQSDEYSFKAASTSSVSHLVYITSAAGLVKVHMIIYVNWKKVSQYIELGAQFSRGYRFIDIFSSTSCQLSIGGTNSYSVVHQNDQDPFSTQFEIFANNARHLQSFQPGETLKARISQQTSSATKFKTSLGVQVSSYTFNKGGCTNPCSWNRIPYSMARYPGQTNICMCMNGVYVSRTNTCTMCATSTQGQCYQPAVCGNGVRQYGQACDNKKQEGCKDCNLEPGYACTEDQNKLSTCVIPNELPFLKAKYYFGEPKIFFQGKAGQKWKIIFTNIGGTSTNFKNTLSILSGDVYSQIATSSNTQIQYTIPSDATLMVKSVSQITSISVMKISLYLGITLVKEYYQSLSKYFPNTLDGSKKYRILYQISTTKVCKVKAYLNGDFASQYNVYKPGSNPTTLNNVVTTATYRFTQDQTPYIFDITTPGKWYIQYLIAEDSSSGDLTLDLKTLDISPCQNPCTQYLSETILGLAPGTVDTCLCDDSSTQLLWNPTTKKCEPPVFIVCGNGVKETGEECDNKKQAGCTNCKIATDYFCSEDQNKLSTCAQDTCGDRKKGTKEQCDNGNDLGCTNCKVSTGYQCSQIYGQKSICIGKCGDGIKLESEDCDNGGNAGCTNCKIDQGYNCIQNLYSKSLCQPLCGDGIRAITEQCDNKNNTGCINCKPAPGFKCSGSVGAISNCFISCGDMVFGGTEQCDNGNQAGCSANCVPDKGYICKNEIGASSDCTTVCGDGIRAGSEACDNGKKTGCLACTQFDDGFTCTGAIGQASNCKAVCGDSKRQANEQCDNGNAVGCSKNCLVDIGFSCTGVIGQKSTCSATCGDSIKTSTEQCDNGKKAGCSNCMIQPGYSCKLASNLKKSICTKA